MSSTFTSVNYATSYPLLVTQWAATSQTRHIIHEVLGSPFPDITLQQAGPRTGSMSALFTDEDQASVMFKMLRSIDIVEFSDDSSYVANMTFVANGSITIGPDDQNNLFWRVTFDYLEVQS